MADSAQQAETPAPAMSPKTPEDDSKPDAEEREVDMNTTQQSHGAPRAVTLHLF
jgi:hypothetical protein